jgi:hypothetical protein
MKTLTQSLLVPTLLLALHRFDARGDTDAVAFPPSASLSLQVVGYLNGGVGWSFVPKTNLLVTWVGYKNDYATTEGIAGLRMTFWSSTNTVVASYLSEDLAASAEADTNRVVYGRIRPLLLTSETQYFITSDLGTNTQIVEVFSPDSTQTDTPFFRAAPELAYRGVYDYDVANGFLRGDSFGVENLLLGPTFRFRVASEAVPHLKIELAADVLMLSWPTNTPACVIDTSKSIADANWQEMTDTPHASIVGGRYFFAYRPPDNQPRFFRLRLQ